jgi:hypothetical protein
LAPQRRTVPGAFSSHFYGTQSLFFACLISH